MASDWKIVNLGEILTLQRGHDLPSQKRLSGSVPVISSSGITDYHNEPAAQGPGVITGRYGTIGEVFYSEADYWPLNTTLYVKDFKGNNPKYIYYLLKTIDFHQFNDKSSVPGVNRNHAHLAMVKVADVRTQIRIAEILSSLDDKIELNRQMNRTLEQMARALFKSWFIDFDPVHAKQRGEQPAGMDAETAALFPDRFVEIDGKEVPEGWEWTRLDGILEMQRGFDLPTEQRQEGSIPVVSAGGFHGFHSISRVSAPGIVTGRSGVIGKVFFVSEDFWPLNTTLWVKRLDGIGANYAYELLNTINYQNFSAGSAVPTLNRNHLHCLEVIRPNSDVAQTFENAVEQWRSLIVKNESEISTLSSLRDSLLPRLLSGELDVSDWETAVEAPEGAPA